MLYLKAVILVVMGVSMGSAFHLVMRTDLGSIPASADAGDAQATGTVDLSSAKRAFDTASATFVDARPRWLYEAGHISGALSLPLQDYEEVASSVLADLSRQTRLVTFCDGEACNSSVKLADRLVEEAGFMQVAVMAAGWPAWTQAGYPARTGSEP